MSAVLSPKVSSEFNARIAKQYGSGWFSELQAKDSRFAKVIISQLGGQTTSGGDLHSPKSILENRFEGDIRRILGTSQKDFAGSDSVDQPESSLEQSQAEPEVAAPSDFASGSDRLNRQDSADEPEPLPSSPSSSRKGGDISSHALPREDFRSQDDSHSGEGGAEIARLPTPPALLDDSFFRESSKTPNSSESLFSAPDGHSPGVSFGGGGGGGGGGGSGEIVHGVVQKEPPLDVPLQPPTSETQVHPSDSLEISEKKESCCCNRMVCTALLVVGLAMTYGFWPQDL